jgi:hypothetical protein
MHFAVLSNPRLAPLESCLDTPHETTTHPQAFRHAFRTQLIRFTISLHVSLHCIAQHEQNSGNTIGTYKAIATFTNTHQAPNILDFRVGDIVHVLNNSEDKEWWYGYVSSSDGRTKMEGYFPGSYLETMDRAAGLRDGREKTHKGSGFSGRMKPTMPGAGPPSGGVWTENGFVASKETHAFNGGAARSDRTGPGGQAPGPGGAAPGPVGGAIIEMINGVAVGNVVDDRDAVPMGRAINAVDPSLMVGVNHVATELLRQKEESKMSDFDSEEKARTLLKLQNQFFGNFNFVKKGRWLVRAGTLGKKGGFGYEPKMFFLFNDMILYANQLNPLQAMQRSRDQYGVHGRINDVGRCYEFRKRYVFGRTFQMEDRYGTKFAFNGNSGKKCEIKCPDKSVKTEWMTLIRQCMAGNAPPPNSFARRDGNNGKSSISIPTAISEWSVLNVGSWLLLTGYDKYIKKFKANGIDGPQLMNANDKRLYDMGVGSDDRCSMMREIARLAKNCDGTHAPQSATQLNGRRKSELGNFFAGVANVTTYSVQGLVNNRPVAPQAGTFIPHVGLRDAVRPNKDRSGRNKKFSDHERDHKQMMRVAESHQQQGHNVFYPIGSSGAKNAATKARRERAPLPGRR